MLKTSDSRLPVTVTVNFDDCTVFSGLSSQLPSTITHCFDDGGGEHVVSIQLKNKTALHTRVDDQGKILSDVTINVEQIMLDYVNITDFFNLGNCDYVYDDAPNQSDKFWGVLGRNGQVKFAFSSPTYQWLIKNYQHWTPNAGSQ